MRIARMAALFAITLASLAQAKVTGNRAEVLGTQWDRVDYDQWLAETNALVTPELSNLALQSCLRDSQQLLDVPAYAVAQQLVREMDKAFHSAPDAYGQSLLSLTRLLEAVQQIPVEEERPSVEKYMSDCKSTVDAQLESARGSLQPLYEGRMHPTVPEALRAKGIELQPLTWDGLRESICTLEGYYSTSDRPELWKFFSTTRVMANVLPTEAESEKFVKAVSAAPEVVRFIDQINVYSSVAGKYNGASIGMTEEEIRTAPSRLTGPALGSKAIALMAFFTTAWREQLQKLTMDQDYPAQPFQLIRADQTLQALSATAEDHGPGARGSQTEIAMDLGWSLLSSESAVYGDVTSDYRNTAILAWLALNAETNIRQNEKLPGVVATAVEQTPNPAILGNPVAYERLGKQIEAALKAYRAVDTEGTMVPGCVGRLKEFAEAAQEIEAGQVDTLDDEQTAVLSGIKFKPVIAEIGQEVKDKDDGTFRFHLAMGRGHEVPATVGDTQYMLWTPSAEVLHLDKLTTTAEWQGGLVDKYDPEPRRK